MNRNAPIAKCGFYCGACSSFVNKECEGCLDGKHTLCYTKKCTEEKNLDFCGHCEKFPCEELLTREKSTVLSKSWLLWKKSQKTK